MNNEYSRFTTDLVFANEPVNAGRRRICQATLGIAVVLVEVDVALLFEVIVGLIRAPFGGKGEGLVDTSPHKMILVANV